jgi:hypothetical protein
MTVVGLMLVALIGYALLRVVTAYGVGYERSRLAARAAVIGRSFDAGTIQKLTGREADESTPAFRSIVARLVQQQTDNRDCRFIYLMGRKNGAVIFLADATDPSSPDYSPPGEVYEEATPALISSFATGEPFVEGPDTDRWGTWVSGLAPIRDPSGQRVVAILGMDVNAARWGITLGIGRTLAGLVTILLAWAMRAFVRRVRA